MLLGPFTGNLGRLWRLVLREGGSWVHWSLTNHSFLWGTPASDSYSDLRLAGGTCQYGLQATPHLHSLAFRVYGKVS